MRPPRRILVIALRRLGDLLLATPLLHALKAHWPEAAVDVLVTAGSEGMLEGNADVARVLGFRRGGGGFALLRTIARRYDLAINLQPEDRGHLLALCAAPRRASILPPAGQPGCWWKRALNQYTVPANLHDQHAVIQYLQLADALGLQRTTAVVPPNAAVHPQLRCADGSSFANGRRYAVVHPVPMYPYKAWAESGWRECITGLAARGLDIVLSGGAGAAERQAIDRILDGLAPAVRNRTLDTSGRLSLAGLAGVLAGAAVHVGPDTAITHLAAATGIPTIALFGPSNPVAWGPWPQGCAQATGSPWTFIGAEQHQGNVWLLQGTRERRPGCIPCLAEGCERRRDSGADCLDHLEPARVLAALAAALAPA